MDVLRPEKKKKTRFTRFELEMIKITNKFRFELIKMLTNIGLVSKSPKTAILITIKNKLRFLNSPSRSM
jgi:hypothetical protein